MRLIGHVSEEASARTFGDYLYALGIENQLDYEKSAGWGIWINDEDKIEQAAKLLEEFRADPKNPKYGSEKERAAALRAKEEAGQEAYRKRLRNRRHLFRPLTAYGVGPLTFVLIAISVVVFVLIGFGKEPTRLVSLFITDYTTDGMYVRWFPGLQEIRQGQVWRLITPIFIHFDPMHIFFDMWILRDFGSMIEARQSSWHLLILTVAIAAVSNFGQYYYGHGPTFGGMSGVDYGLMGYIWIRGRWDPGSGLFLHPSSVTMMIVWFFACLLGFVGNIANWVHSIGLVMGMAWGYLSSWRYRPGKRK
jgi:GlpG protein